MQVTSICRKMTLCCDKQAAELAKDFTSKLITSGAAEAKSSMMRLAGDVSSWWAALDPGLPPTQEASQPSARSQQVRLKAELFVRGAESSFTCLLGELTKQESMS